jgi:hypothetical protein
MEPAGRGDDDGWVWWWPEHRQRVADVQVHGSDRPTVEIKLRMTSVYTVLVRPQVKFLRPIEG